MPLGTAAQGRRSSCLQRRESLRNAVGCPGNRKEHARDDHKRGVVPRPLVLCFCVGREGQSSL